MYENSMPKYCMVYRGLDMSLGISIKKIFHWGFYRFPEETLEIFKTR